MILGTTGEKMSKSRGNVINPDDIIASHGADSLRLFEMFFGPLEDMKPWSPTGLDGAKRFLDRVYRLIDDPELSSHIVDTNSGELDYSYNFLVKKATNDFESLSFNTAIAQMMVFINDCYKAKSIYKPYVEGFVQILGCISPFLGEELWQRLGHKELLHESKWPSYDESKLVLNTVKIALAVNGKMRDVIEVATDCPKEEIEKLALENEKIKAFTEGKQIKKVIVVPGKIVNIVAI